MTAVASGDAKSSVRGIARASGATRRAQYFAALAVHLIPTAGVAIAIGQLVTRGPRLGELLLLAAGYALTCLGVTMGFHRHYAHRAFDTSAPMQLVLVAFASMAAQGPLLFWVATHRRHHAYSDREGDPHSPNLSTGRFPRLRGLAHAHMGWMLSDEVTSWPVFARDLLRSDRAYRLHRMYGPFLALGLIAPAVVGYGAWGGAEGAFQGVLWGGLVRVWLMNQASWCVGSVAHMFGSRRFATPDKSANNWAVALLTGGEGLQNNHHAFPSSALHSLRWWEPDFTGVVVRACEKLGLVWNVKVPSARAVASAERKHVLLPELQDWVHDTTEGRRPPERS